MCIVNGNVYQVMDYSEVIFVLGPMIKLIGSFFLSMMSTLPLWLLYCSVTTRQLTISLVLVPFFLRFTFFNGCTEMKLDSISTALLSFHMTK